MRMGIGILGGIGRRLGRPGRSVEPPRKMQPPLTPMIDVTFLLLLFFLLATTFRQAEGQIAGALPQRMDAVTIDRNIVKPIRMSILPADSDGGAEYGLAGSEESFAGPDELFAKLSQDGEVLMPLGAYPFSRKFGWLADRFGVSWQLNLPND